MNCDRCGNKTFSVIMSMYNTENICLDCKQEERKRPDYHLAEAKDLEEYAYRVPPQFRQGILDRVTALRSGGN